MSDPIRSVDSLRTRLVRGSCFALLAFVAACAGPGSARPGPRQNAAPTTVCYGTILGDPAGDPEAELELLGNSRTHAAMLRRAFLELKLGHHQNAIDATAEVLYGQEKPSANDESFARYLRAEAYAARGNPEFGRFDRDRARELALDADLRRLLQPVATAPRAPNAAPSQENLALEVMPRSAWHARPIDRSDIEPMSRPTRITVHHSAMYFRDTRMATCAAQLQKIQRDHMQGSGWADIGYHFVIDPAGRVWQGRELKWQGAHAEGRNNVGNIGICLLGNFMRGRDGQTPSRQQIASLRQLVSQLMERYDIGPEGIHGHRDFKPTDCPGPQLMPIVVQMQRELGRHGARVAATP